MVKLRKPVNERPVHSPLRTASLPALVRHRARSASASDPWSGLVGSVFRESEGLEPPRHGGEEEGATDEHGWTLIRAGVRGPNGHPALLRKQTGNSAHPVVVPHQPLDFETPRARRGQNPEGARDWGHRIPCLDLCPSVFICGSPSSPGSTSRPLSFVGPSPRSL